MDSYWDMFREIRTIKICPKMILKDYGSKAAFILNYSTGVSVKQGGVQLDVLAADLGFECADDLYEAMINYQPEHKFWKELQDYHDQEESHNEFDELPF